MSDPMPNLKAVNDRLREAAKTLPGQLVVAVQKKMVLDFLAGAIKRTPVATGRARGGWQVTIGAPSSGAGSPESGSVGDPTGATYTAGLAELAKLQPFSIVFVTNNVTYILALDRGMFVPTDPPDDPDARRARRGRRSQRERSRALAARGDEGATLVAGGYSLQAPHGMTALALQDVLEGLR